MKNRNARVTMMRSERRKRLLARYAMRTAIEAGKMSAAMLATVVMYDILSIVAYMERGYFAIGGEVLAAVLFGIAVYYGISYAVSRIWEAAGTKKDTI